MHVNREVTHAWLSVVPEGVPLDWHMFHQAPTFAPQHRSDAARRFTTRPWPCQVRRTCNESPPMRFAITGTAASSIKQMPVAVHFCVVLLFINASVNTTDPLNLLSYATSLYSVAMMSAITATTLHIAFIADEAYAVGLAAAVQSLVESLHTFNRPAEIWVLDLGLSEQSKRWLLRIQDMLQQPRTGSTTPDSSNSSSSGSNSQAAESPEVLMHIVAPPLKGPVGELLSQLPPAMLGYAASATWAKLFLPDLLPSTAMDKHGLLLYMDSDVLVAPNTDIGQIWDVWIQDNLDQIPELPSQPMRRQAVLAAVRDFGLPCGHAHLQALGWGEQSPGDPGLSSLKYFNAGILLLHVPSFQENVKPEIQQFLQHHCSGSAAEGSCGSSGSAAASSGFTGGGGHTDKRLESIGSLSTASHVTNTRSLSEVFPYADQDVLNLVIGDRGGWLELSAKWNVQGIGSYLMDRCSDHGPDKPALFTRTQATQLEASPAIIHFTGTPKPKPSELLNPWVTVPTKPWSFISTHPHRQLFYHFLNKTHWQGMRAQQVDLESAAVDELQELAGWVDNHCAAEAKHSTISGSFNKQQFFSSIGQRLQTAAAEAAGTSSTGSAVSNLSALSAAATDSTALGTSSRASTAVDKAHDTLHPVFLAFKDPPDPNLDLAGLVLDAEAGFRFTDVWFDPHAPSWEEHVIPHILPLGPGSRPVRVLEVGLWEGRSTCYILMKISCHTDSKMVCIDPFDRLYPQFGRNKVSWLRNVAAAGGLGTAAAQTVTAAGAAAAAAVSAQPPSNVPVECAEVSGSALEAPALSADIVHALSLAAISGAEKVQLLHETSAAALSRLLLSSAEQQQEASCSLQGTVPSTGPRAAAAGRSTVGNSTEPTTADAAVVSSCHGPLFDLVYIDGSHMRVDVLMDAVLAWPLLQAGGLMVFDDYEWDRYRDNMVCHPKEGIDAFLAVHAHQLDIIHRGYQVVLKKKLETD